MFISTLLIILGIVVSLVIVFALNAPVELLAWWTGARAAGRRPARLSMRTCAWSDARRPVADHYIVYLSGVGRSSGKSRVEKEENFLNMVETGAAGLRHGAACPYSVSNTPLTEMRPCRPCGGVFHDWRAAAVA